VSKCRCGLSWIERNESYTQAISDANSYGRTGFLSSTYSAAISACSNA
jgi:hypothetical protein